MPGNGPFAGRTLGSSAASQLIKLFDRKGSQTIDFHEYAALHSFMDKMNTAFYKADSNSSGYLNENETNQAMNQAGFFVVPQIIQMYYNKYNLGQGLNFIRFMQAVADIALIKTKFEVLDTDKDGKLDLNQVLTLCAKVSIAPPPPQIPAQPVQDANHGGTCTIS